MPGEKPTEMEKEERVELVRRLLVQRHPKSVIKRMVREKYGPLDHRTIEGYLARARELLLYDIRREKLDMRALSLATYHSVICNPACTELAKLKAQERIDKLLGLEERIPDDPAYLLEQYGFRPEDIAADDAANVPPSVLPPETDPPVPGLPGPAG